MSRARGSASGLSATSRGTVQRASSAPSSAPPPGEEGALDQELTHQLRPARPQRLTDRHVAPTVGGAYQHQVGEVRAGDEEEERDRAQEDPQGLAEAARELLAIGDGEQAALGRVALRKLLLEAALDAVEVVGDLGTGDARSRPPDRAQEVRGFPVLTPRIAVRRQRDRDLGQAHGEEEIAFHHTDHGEGLSVQGQRPSDDGGVAAEAPLPQAVRQYGDLLVARRVVHGGQGPADGGVRAERLEEAARDAQAGQALGRSVARQVGIPVREARDRLEGLVLVAIVAELGELQRIAVGRGVARPEPVEPGRDSPSRLPLSTPRRQGTVRRGEPGPN